MADHPQAAQFRADVVSLMVGLMRQQQAPWQRADRADLPAPIMPFNGVEGANRIFRSTNALCLIAAMQSHGWSDPRFVTAKQAETAGWEVKPGGGTELIFWRGLHTQGRGLATRVSGETPTAEIFRLFNAAEVIGMPARPAPLSTASKIDMQEFAHSIGGREERARLLSSSALARRAAVQMLGRHPENNDEWRHTLRVQLAGFLFAREMGEWFRPAPEPVSQLPMTAKLLEDPDEFFRAARDAQLMAGEIVQLAKAQQKNAQAPAQLQTNTTTPTKPATAIAAHGVASATVRNEKASVGEHAEPRFFLAVPFAEISQARAAGATWSKEDKAWWVPAGSDLSKVDRWKPATQGWDETEVLDAFAQAMASYGLSCPGGGPIGDGQWHYVPTMDAKGKKKQGSYILNTKGATPKGYIHNFKGASGPWRYDGVALSPEVRAAYAAQAREQSVLRERELRQQQQEIAARTAEVLDTLPVAMDAKHGYLQRKGVSAHGLLLCNAEDKLQQLLNLPDFKAWDDTYLVVPGRDMDGNLLTVQAVAGRDGGGKIFTKGAAKSGAMHLIGAEKVADLVAAPAVIFVEGYATGASLYEDLGKTVPVVVAFDANNLVRVAKDLSEVLPSKQHKLVCGDNDQFRVERALDEIREVMPELSETPTTGQSLKVLSGEGVGMRDVFLGPVLADNQWHQTPLGKYRLAVESPDSVRVDAIRDGSTKHVQMVLGNKGRECAAKAAEILGGKVALPEFSSLAGRPTDYNDLSQREGAAAVQRFIASALGTNMVEVNNARPSVRAQGQSCLAAGAKR